MSDKKYAIFISQNDVHALQEACRLYLDHVNRVLCRSPHLHDTQNPLYVSPSMLFVLDVHTKAVRDASNALAHAYRMADRAAMEQKA